MSAHPTAPAPNPLVDRYITNARPFAQPILRHLRDALHHAVPGIEETIKWSMPFFVHRGVILANMAGHKEHASFGLWGAEMAGKLREDGMATGTGMGTFGRLTSVEDLPPAAQLNAYLQQAAALIEDGTRTRSIQRIAKPGRQDPEVPGDLAAALQSNQAAATAFAGMSPSCQREYITWIGEARREDTRARRVATTLEWLAEGKSRYWKSGSRA